MVLNVYNINMNRLSRERRIKILNLLVEGLSIRSIARVEDISLNTVAKLLHEAGAACKNYHNKHVRGIVGRRKVQCDELWSFVYAKDRAFKSEELPVPYDIGGTVWTWTALDADSKLLISCFVRLYRSHHSAIKLFRDVKSRLVETP